VQELGPILVDLSVCSDQELRIRNKDLLTRVFDLLLVNY
jgi:hypothetical protein